MAIAYEKYHGTGNDFIAVEAGAPVEDWGAFAIEHCDRETGVHTGTRRGADGVLVLSFPGDDPSRSRSRSRVRMRLYQPNGGTAAMCGNGARCAARWAARRRSRNHPGSREGSERSAETEFIIATPAGDRRATVGEEVTIEMGESSFAPEDVPLARDDPLIDMEIEGWKVTAVNTGVPHAVCFVEDVSSVDLESMAPPIRHAEVFPEGANVNVAAPRDGKGDADGAFDQRTFERGVEGETRSCGTGAVAIAAVARQLGLAGETIRVSPPGGELSVTVPDSGSATLAGPAVLEGEGELPVP